MINLPNRLSLARLGVCALLTICLEIAWPWRGTFAFLLFTIASITDWLDGYLARKLNQITDLGKLLDPLADKVMTTVAYIGLVANGLAPLWLVVCIITREFLITGLRSLAASHGIILSADRSGKHKTISQIITALLGLLILAAIDLKLDPRWIDFALLWLLTPMMWLTLFITVYSGANYFIKNRSLLFHANLKQPPPKP